MESDAEIIETLCDRFRLAAEASGYNKSKFAKAVGLSPQQLSNLGTHRNPPSHMAIWRAIRAFGFTADWFYTGSHVGFRDPQLLDRLRTAEAQWARREGADAEAC